MTVYLTLIVVLAAIIAVTLIWRQVAFLRKCEDEIVCEITNPSITAFFNNSIDRLTLWLNRVGKDIMRAFYFYVLVISRRIFLVMQVIIAAVDKKFLKLIHSAHGKNINTKSGSASFFLTEIKNFRDTAGPGRIDA